MLILAIRIGEIEIILVEVEPRPTETSAYRLVAFEREQPIEARWVEPALNAMRAAKGTFDEKHVGQIFRSLTTRHPSTRKHAYRTRYNPHTKEKDVFDLDERALGHWLLSVAASAGLETRDRGARLNSKAEKPAKPVAAAGNTQD